MEPVTYPKSFNGSVENMYILFSRDYGPSYDDVELHLGVKIGSMDSINYQERQRSHSR